MLYSRIWIALSVFLTSATFLGTHRASAEDAPEIFNVVFPTGSVVNGSGQRESAIEAGASATDPAGNTYVTGNFSGQASFGTNTVTSSGGYGFPDLFLAKYAADGSVAWAVRAGGEGRDFGRAITLDTDGNIYVAGTSDSQQAKFGSQNTAFLFQSMFIAKYNSAGTCLWVQKGGGYLKIVTPVSGVMTVNALALDPAGNPVVAGGYAGTPMVGTLSLTNANVLDLNSQDLYAAKFSKDGSTLWARGYGGTNAEYATALTIDPSGGIYLGGVFNRSTLLGTTTFSNNATAGAFLLKLNAQGELLWSKSLTQPKDTWPSYVRSVMALPDGRVLSALQTGVPIFTLGAFTIENHVTSPAFNPVEMGLLVAYDMSGNLQSVVRTPFNVEGRGLLNNGLALSAGGNGSVFARSDAPVMVNDTTLGTSGLSLIKYTSKLEPVWTNRVSRSASGSAIPTGTQVLQALGEDAAGNLHLAATFRADAGTPLTLGWTNVYPFSAFGNQLVLFQVKPSFSAIAPGFVQQPTNLFFQPPAGFTNSALARAWPAPSYLWYQNGKPLPSQTNFVLTFSSSTAASAGNYFLVASNAYGRATSEVFRAQTPLNFDLLPPAVVSVALGSRVTLTAVASGTTQITYQWQHAGTNLPNATNATLLLDSANAQSAGSYQLKICNASGCLTSPLTQLQVLNAGSVDASGAFNGLGKGLSCVAVQPDGNLLVATGLNLLRASPAGAIDDAFIPPPTLFNHWGFNGESYGPKVVRVEPDGSIMVGGDFMIFRLSDVTSFPAPRIARVLPNGTLDSTFNPGSGPTNSIDGPSFSRVNDVIRQPDGKYLIGGLFNKYNGSPAVNLLRLNHDGSIDPSFTSPAMQFSPSGSGPGEVHSLALQPDGRIVVGGEFFKVNGSGYNDVVRLNANGTVDSSFAAPPLPLPPFSRVEHVQVLPGGQVLAAGSFAVSTTGRRSILLLNPDGTPDPAFLGNVGSVSTVLRLPDGKLVVGGQGTFTRLLPNGKSDDAFQAASVLTQGATASLALESSGSILAAGTYGLVRVVSEQVAPARVAPTFAPGSVVLLENGQINFTVCGQPGQIVRVDSSPDLRNWQPLTNVTLAAGCSLVSDPGSTAEKRFYRLLLP